MLQWWVKLKLLMAPLLSNVWKLANKKTSQLTK